MKRVALMATAGLMAGGCSFFMETVPKRWKGKTDPECMTGRVVPSVDLAIAVASFVTMGVVGVRKETLPIGGLGALFGFGSLTGFSYASECRDAYERYRTYRRDHDEGTDEVEDD